MNMPQVNFNQKVSIIVPVYNAEKWLSRCIQSIIDQTYKNLEIILVNDGSSDNSLQICNKYSTLDNRIKIIDKRNGGASSARNAGLDACSGEWVCFADADDYVGENYVKDMVLNIADVDIAIEGLTILSNGFYKEIVPEFDGVIDISEDLTILLNNLNIFRFCGSYAKLFRVKLLKKYKIQFSKDIICAEDYDFLIRYLSISNSVRLQKIVNGYYYDSHAGSVSTRIYSYDKELSGLKQLYNSIHSFCSRYRIQKTKIPQFRNIISYYVYRVIMSLYQGHENNRNDRIHNIKSIPSYLMSYYVKYFDCETIFLKVFHALIATKCYTIADMLMMWAFKKNG